MRKPEILSLLQPLFPAFVKCVRQAWTDYETMIPAETRPSLSPTTRANFVHDRMIYHLGTALGSTEICRLIEKGMLRYLHVQGEELSVGVRAKKLDEEFRSSNYPTIQQTQLREQMTFPWYAEETYIVILGYTVTTIGIIPSIDKIALTQENEEAVEWKEVLWEAAAERAPIPTDVQAPVPDVTVRPRIDTSRENAKQG